MFRTILMVCVSLLVVGCAPAVVSVPVPGKLPELEAGVHRQEISVPDVGDVKCAIKVDPSYNPDSAPVPLVLVLHYGYEGSKPDAYTGADMMDSLAVAVREIGGIAIAPDVVGGDWKSSKNERSAVWLVKSAMNTYNIDSSQVYVIGYSMGGEGTWHIAGRNQDLFTGAIPIAAPVTGTKQWKIPVYAIHSNKDNVVPYSRAKKHSAAIEKAGGTIQFKTVEGLTHYNAGAYDYHAFDGVKWIRAQ